MKYRAFFKEESRDRAACLKKFSTHICWPKI